MMAINGYGDGERRDRGCKMWKEKIENLEKWVLSKTNNKLIFYIRNEFEYEFEVDIYIPITRLILEFWNREKSKLCQSGKNLSIWLGFGWLPTCIGFVAMSACTLSILVSLIHFILCFTSYSIKLFIYSKKLQTNEPMQIFFFFYQNKVSYYY